MRNPQVEEEEPVKDSDREKENQVCVVSQEPRQEAISSSTLLGSQVRKD